MTGKLLDQMASCGVDNDRIGIDTSISVIMAWSTTRGLNQYKDAILPV